MHKHRDNSAFTANQVSILDTEKVYFYLLNFCHWDKAYLVGSAGGL